MKKTLLINSDNTVFPPSGAAVSYKEAIIGKSFDSDAHRNIIMKYLQNKY